jgi:hypothetical protein
MAYGPHGALAFSLYLLRPESAGAFTPMEPVDAVFSSDGATDAGGLPGGATSALVAAAVMAEYIDMMS